MREDVVNSTNAQSRPRRRASVLGLMGASLALSALAFTGMAGVASAGENNELTVCNEGSGYDAKAVTNDGAHATDLAQPGECKTTTAPGYAGYHITFSKDGKTEDYGGDFLAVYDGVQGTGVVNQIKNDYANKEVVPYSSAKWHNWKG